MINSTAAFLTLTLILVRVGGLMSFAPFWSHRAVTMRVRALLALVIALLLTPVSLSQKFTPPADALGLSLIVLMEFLMGCLLGFISRLMFSALDLAAQILGFQMGLSLAATIDPATRAQTAALGTIAQMFGLLVLLESEGHGWLLLAIARHQDFFLPEAAIFQASMTELLIRLSAEALVAGTGLSASALIVLLAMEFFLAIAGRAAPQLQVMLLSFPLKIAVGFWLTGATLFFLPGGIRSLFSQVQQVITGIIR